MKTCTGTKLISALDLRILNSQNQNQNTTPVMQTDFSLGEEEGLGRAQQQTNKGVTNPLESSVDITCQNSRKT